MENLSGSFTVVTGGARGIGRAIALALAAAGAEVLVTDIDPGGAADTADAARGAGGRARAAALDIADPAGIAGFFAQMEHEGRAPDLLVNNAGVSRQTDFFDLRPEDIDTMLQVNVRGTLLMMQGAARLMRRRQAGRIVNLSSIAGKGYRHTSNIAYAASKGAIVTMTRIAAARLGADGITVNAICPGLTRTDLMDDWIRQRAALGGTSEEAERQSMAAGSALGRINLPEDIAAAVLFLAGPAGRNITGQSLNIDAGIMWD